MGIAGSRFRACLQTRETCSELIDKLLDLAIAEKDKATEDFLWGFVREQTEEENTAKSILDKFHIYGVHGLVCIDKELGKR